MAKHFHSRPEVTHLFSIAKNALEPRGTSYGIPEVTPEAAALLDSFASEREALAGLLDALSSGKNTEGGQSGRAQAVLPPLEEARKAVSSVTPAGGEGELTTAVLAELEGLIGLASVKRRVMSVIAVVQANEERTKAERRQLAPDFTLYLPGPLAQARRLLPDWSRASMLRLGHCQVQTLLRRAGQIWLPDMSGRPQ